MNKRKIKMYIRGLIHEFRKSKTYKVFAKINNFPFN